MDKPGLLLKLINIFESSFSRGYYQTLLVLSINKALDKGVLNIQIMILDTFKNHVFLVFSRYHKNKYKVKKIRTFFFKLNQVLLMFKK